MPKTSHRKIVSVWSMLILLTLLVLVGNYYGSGKTNAKYVKKIETSSTARVACFVSDVSNVTANSSVVLSPNTSGYVSCYTFSVTNQRDGKVSEVAMDYSLDIEVMGPNGVGYRISPTPESVNACNQSTKMEGNVLSTDCGVFQAGVEETHHYVIEACWEDTSAVSYENANVPISVRVTANVVQKD